MPQYWIGLGGNQGDVPAAFREVVVRLAQLPGATGVACSPVYRTAPMGVQSGGPFWNAVAGSETRLSPFELLDKLQTWETEFGRVRTTPWGPRTLDLDLLFYGDQVLDDPRLTLPHPGAWYRRFVLDPLLAVAPGLIHPVWRLTNEQLRTRLTLLATLRVFGASADIMNALQQRWRERSPGAALAASDGDKRFPSGLLVAIATESPEAWRETPHLRFDPDLPHDTIVQALVEAAVAAFDVPQRESTS